MIDLVSKVEAELNKISKTAGGAHLKTSEIRKLSASLYREISNKSKENIFAICQMFLEQDSWPMSVIAYDFAYRVKKQYDDNTFSIFERWLFKYVKNWSDCDDFCTHAFGELIKQNISLFEKVISWTKHEKFTVRRAAAVVLIPLIRQGKYKEIKPTLISDLLMLDSEDLVLKGYGWMLKELSIKEPDLVYEYLKKNSDLMPRVAFRYALEKMEDDKRMELMNL